MPSWNIHTAHVERLLREHEAELLGVRDINAFLFGNFVPDIYVGYMVAGTTCVMDYRVTHFAETASIPLPRADEFYERFIANVAADEVSDVTLGAWAHLVADHVYNKHTRAFLAAHNMKPGDKARQGKQADFALFGRTLDISMRPYVDETLLAQCAAFPQYPIAETDVYATVEVACQIVDTNQREHVTGEPAYQMLDAAFFESARAEANDWMASGLIQYAARL